MPISYFHIFFMVVAAKAFLSLSNTLKKAKWKPPKHSDSKVPALRRNIWNSGGKPGGVAVQSCGIQVTAGDMGCTKGCLSHHPLHHSLSQYAQYDW